MTEALQRRDTTAVATKEEWEMMKDQATYLIRSKLLPGYLDTAEKVIVVYLQGKDLGLTMMQSVRSIYVVDGKPSLSAELMSALVMRNLPGSVLRPVKISNLKVTYEAKRPEWDKPITYSFSMEDAKTAELSGKGPWKKYPMAMMRSRCVSAICKVAFPDIVLGFYTPEELDVEVNEDGTVIAPSVGKEVKAGMLVPQARQIEAPVTPTAQVIDVKPESKPAPIPEQPPNPAPEPQGKAIEPPKAEAPAPKAEKPVEEPAQAPDPMVIDRKLESVERKKIIKALEAGTDDPKVKVARQKAFLAFIGKPVTEGGWGVESTGELKVSQLGTAIAKALDIAGEIK
jgi:hypothetical protein